jgi:hypothetical protein
LFQSYLRVLWWLCTACERTAVGTDVTKNRTERNSGDRDMKILFKGKEEWVLLKDKEKIKRRRTI